MSAQNIPDTRTLEGARISSQTVAPSGSAIIAPHFIQLYIIVPSGTTATVQLAEDDEFDVTSNFDLNLSNRAIVNEVVVTNSAGSGTLILLTGRVAGRE